MRAYERFLDYAVIHTTSSPESGLHPSTGRQFDLAHKLVAELQELGVSDAAVDERCYIYGTLPAEPGYEQAAALGFIAHMDTAPDASGENVRPQLHPDYNGGDVTLPSGRVLSVRKFPVLSQFKGETLITSDGTTLLGADDKAGIAEIMTAVERIVKDKLPHGKLCIGFTPDEEIGEGADGFSVARFGADFAYTVDGGDVGELEYENFNACSARVDIHGCSVHPGDARNKMINAVNVGLLFQQMLPQQERPEYTEGYEGFYHLHDMRGNVSLARLDYIVRDFDRDSFEHRKQVLRDITALLNDRYGAGTVELTVTDSYRNMKEMILPHRHLIDNALQAISAAGIVPHELPIRSGTDGATLSYMGLPCPNLGTGGHNFHGEYECITVERMDRSVEVLLNLVRLYSAMPR